MSLDPAAGGAGERAAARRGSPAAASGGGALAAPASYARLYALVIAVLAADIAVLAWLTGRWQ